MRFTQQEKYEIISLVDGSDLSANRTLKELGIHKRTFYNCYNRYLAGGYDGLAPKAIGRHQTWNTIPSGQREQVIEEALEHEEHSSRELAFHIIDQHKWYISESSVYRILKHAGLITSPAHIVLSAGDEFEKKTKITTRLRNWFKPLVSLWSIIIIADTTNPLITLLLLIFTLAGIRKSLKKDRK